MRQELVDRRHEVAETSVEEVHPPRRASVSGSLRGLSSFVTCLPASFSSPRMPARPTATAHDNMSPASPAPPRLPQDRRPRARRPHPAEPAAGRARPRHPVVAQVGHPHLPGRRAAAPGHVRPQARRPEGSRRPVEADRDQRHRHPDLRGPAPAREDHGQARRRPLARRQPGRPRRDPGLQRPPPAQADARRRLAAVRLRGGEAAGRGRSRASRRSSACVTPAPTARTTSPAPASSAPSLAPFRAMGPTRDDMLLRGITVDRLADRKTLLQELRRHAPRRRRHRRDARRWTPSPNRRSGCSPPRAWPTRSTCRRSRARSSSATAPATRRCSWTATAPARAAEPADGPAAGRGRRPRRHAELQQVGLARRQERRGPGQQLHLPARGGGLPRLRPVRQRPGRGPARARPGQGLHA